MRSRSVLLLLVLCLPMAGAVPSAGPHYDLVLKDGLLVDGTGGPPYRGDLALKDGRIAALGDLGNYRAEGVVDVRGMVVAPGFIDILCHNDLLWNFQEQERAVRGGVTSGLAGNCGFSVLDVDKNLAKLQKHHSLINLGTLIGQGSVRDWFIRKDRRKPASPADLEKMKAFVKAGLQAGAFGLSSGLGYEPGEWCAADELEQLASVLPQYPHAAYYTHIRNYRSNVLEAIREAVRVGKDAGVPVIIQHLLFKLPSNWDQTESGLRILEEARGRGQKVFATVYPYDFWGNEVQIPLAQFLYLPKDVDRWAYYRNAERREEVLAKIRRRLSEYGGGDKIEVTKVHFASFKDVLGRNLRDLARARRLAEEEMVLTLLLENRGDVRICYHGLSEEGLIKKIQSPFILFGSDSTGAIPHPRDVGAFPRLLGEYVREKRVVRLSEAVHRLTEEPAGLLGLKDRGLLKEGYWGDVVVFDMGRVRDRATALSPWEPPEGIRRVLVNGQTIYEGNGFKGNYPGMVLRRGNDGP